MDDTGVKKVRSRAEKIDFSRATVEESWFQRPNIVFNKAELDTIVDMQKLKLVKDYARTVAQKIENCILQVKSGSVSKKTITIRAYCRHEKCKFFALFHDVNGVDKDVYSFSVYESQMEVVHEQYLAPKLYEVDRQPILDMLKINKPEQVREVLKSKIDINKLQEDKNLQFHYSAGYIRKLRCKTLAMQICMRTLLLIWLEFVRRIRNMCVNQVSLIWIL
jgi:hypothetical protein